MINICNSFKITFLVQQLLKDRQLLQQHHQEMLTPASVKATLPLPSPAPHKKPEVNACTEEGLPFPREDRGRHAAVGKHHDPVPEATRQVLQ